VAKRIFKYELNPEGRQMLMMPRGAQPLSVEQQRDLPVLFALVDDEQPLESRIFRAVTTGEIFNPENSTFVGTIFLGGDKPEEAWFTMHVWEQPEGVIDPIHPRFADDYHQLQEELKQ
jgi:hypothetical protein